MTAPVIFTIWRKAGVPSCIRVPPPMGNAMTGSRSAVARSRAAVMNSPPLTPIEPPMWSPSPATQATRRPRRRASPASTAGSVTGNSQTERSSNTADNRSWTDRRAIASSGSGSATRLVPGRAGHDSGCP